MIDPTERRAVLTDEASFGDDPAPVAAQPMATRGQPPSDGSGSAGGNGEDDDAPRAPLTLLTGGIALGVAIAVGVALFLLARAIPGPDTPADASPALIAARVGEYLARWGLALVVVSFIPAIVVAVLSAFVFPTAAARRGVTTTGLGDAYAKLIDALPGLLRTAPGIGVAVLLLAVLLLLGNSFNGDGSGGTNGGADASPAAATPTAAATETTGPITQP